MSEERLTVEALLRRRARHVVTVPRHKTLQDTIALMRRQDADAVVVADFCATEGEGVWGVLTRKAIIDLLADGGLPALTMPIGRLRSGRAEESVYCDVRRSVDDLVDAMRQREARHAVVMDQDTVVGVLDASEILFSRPALRSLAPGLA